MSLPAPQPLVHMDTFSSPNKGFKPRVDISTRSQKESGTDKQEVDAPRDSQATIVDEDEDTITNMAAYETLMDAPAAAEQQDEVLADSQHESLEQRETKRVIKKVNFWGWVDVGFSYSTDEYDRKPLIVDPLTKNGAMEVIEMRLAMKRASEEMYRWRNEYENNFPTIHGMPLKSGNECVLPRGGALAPITEATGPPRLFQVQQPDYVTPRESLSARFQGMGVRPGSPKSMYPVQSMQQPVGRPQPCAPRHTQVPQAPKGMQPRQWTGGSNQRAQVPQQVQFAKPVDPRGRQSTQPSRRWAWNDRSGSKSPSLKDPVINQPSRIIQGSNASFGKQVKK
ncbi:hypothetical protein BC830DRAFT_1080633 [Chytriomyces sp. MP71]|nr:hypothetical protein BC830DRAFT_1080633 [Chytriomyces sp. MP71]